MKTIQVPVSTSYSVEIGSGLLSSAGEKILTLFPKAERAVIVSDDTVMPLHGDSLRKGLCEAGLITDEWILPHGESSKNAENLLALLNFLVEQHVSRSDILIALGGGVIGDLAGFAAAVYMRGISYIQCPTTILAAVDSSVGGKTAVDLPSGKNLIGAFWQPRLVICDTDTLKTLPPTIFSAGCAEIIKTAVLFDPPLFDTLYDSGTTFDRETVIARCVEHKKNIVAEDEFDTGRRALLNLGHTLAHALEAVSKFELSHGQAVAIGTSVVCRAAAKAGLCSENLPVIVTQVFKKFGLPTSTTVSIDTVMPVMLSDKKRAGSHVNVIIPECIGHCAIHPMSAPELRSFMESGMIE